jgi:orotidine-5'-phosphate decarboxylase
MPSFAERFLTLAKTRSPLCLGIDPAVELLRQWDLPLDASGLRRFCDIAVEAMGDRVAVVKPQSAFFEQFGPEGMAELKRLVGMVKERGSYADAMIGPDSPFGGDAMTAVAYMGFGSLKPLLKKAAERGAGVFVVVRSSNPEGRALQDARHPDGRTVATALADEITAFNTTVTATVNGGVGPVGAVMGATIEGTATETLKSLPKSLILAPGIGAQGATFNDMARNFGAATERALPSVSRGILAKGPDVAALRKAIEENCDLARRARDAARS